MTIVPIIKPHHEHSPPYKTTPEYYSAQHAMEELLPIKVTITATHTLPTHKYHTDQLAARSPRFLELLARRAQRLALAMPAETPDIGYPPLVEKQPFQEPPPVVVTPCDPWPRPYYLENGLRRVAPHHFTYNTYCKERWRGREILDIFSSEFRDRPLEYYVRNLQHRRYFIANYSRKMR